MQQWPDQAVVKHRRLLWSWRLTRRLMIMIKRLLPPAWAVAFAQRCGWRPRFDNSSVPG
eukprot:SAG31_NODE_32117_length_360_cov_0.547893_1_plen_58_part_10